MLFSERTDTRHYSKQIKGHSCNSWVNSHGNGSIPRDSSHSPRKRCALKYFLVIFATTCFFFLLVQSNYYKPIFISGRTVISHLIAATARTASGSRGFGNDFRLEWTAVVQDSLAGLSTTTPCINHTVLPFSLSTSLAMSTIPFGIATVAIGIAHWNSKWYALKPVFLPFYGQTRDSDRVDSAVIFNTTSHVSFLEVILILLLDWFENILWPIKRVFDLFMDRNANWNNVRVIILTEFEIWPDHSGRSWSTQRGGGTGGRLCISLSQWKGYHVSEKVRSKCIVCHLEKNKKT